MRKFSTLVPSDMDKKDLLAVCGSLQVAKNWNQTEETFELTSGERVTIAVSRLSEFQEAFKPITGQTLVSN